MLTFDKLFYTFRILKSISFLSILYLVYSPIRVYIVEVKGIKTHIPTTPKRLPPTVIAISVQRAGKPTAPPTSFL